VLKITKKVEYALMALKFMSSKPKDELTSARELCDEFNTPFDTMAKVLQAMNQAGWLSSIKGIKGGYVLCMDLSMISFMQLNRVIEGQENEDVCTKNNGRCELHGTCNIVTPITTLNKHVNSFLDVLTLNQLLTQETNIQLPTWQIEGSINGIR